MIIRTQLKWILLATVMGASFVRSSSSWAVQAQPVPVPEDSSLFPQINLAGVGITTGTFGQNAEQNQAQAGIDYSDSTLQIGAAQRLYNQSIGSMGLGMLTLGN